MSSASTSPPHGLSGSVTGEVRSGTIGEVMINIRGGSEAFYAHPADESEIIPVGSTILVVEYHPPRTVYVVPWVDDPALS